MKIVSTLFVSIIISAAAFSQTDSAACSQFRQGLYTYTDDSSRTFIIKRTKRNQEETQQGKNIKTRSRIKWISPCNYELRQLWSNNKVKRKSNGAVTLVIITNAGNGQYTYTCDCKNIADYKKFQGTVYRIKSSQ